MTRVPASTATAARPGRGRARVAWAAAAVAAAGGLLAGGVVATAGPPGAGGAVPHLRRVITGWLQGVHTVPRVLLAARDGTPLAVTVMRPLAAARPLPTVLIRTPYGRLDTGRAWARAGFAVVVQDSRGRGESGGRFEPYVHDADDHAATLDWIVAQPWSNGRVGTLGCSAAGEAQLVAATARHPAHRALIAEGAGGAVGTAGGHDSAFGVWEGGIFQLAAAIGWFVRQGDRARPADRPPPDAQAIGAVVGTWPVAGMDRRAGAVDTGFDDFRATPPGDAAWAARGFLDDDPARRVSTPGLHVNGWYDQTVSQTLFAADWLRRHADGDAARIQKVIIGPGLHCDDPGADRGRVGDLPYRGAAAAFDGTYRRWLDAWLREDDPSRAAEQVATIPDVQVFVLGADRWLASPSWPPPQARTRHWHLHADADGTGRLLPEAPGGAPTHDRLPSDPTDPVPTVGGAFCCTGDAAGRQGPVDSAALSTRADVRVYTSDPLPAPLVIAGPVALEVTVSTTGHDADVVARLVDVAPDGRALVVQVGALRLSRRDGGPHDRPVRPDEPVAVRVPMRDIAWRVPAGHRLRLLVAGSDFPRLERNLHLGGDTRLATGGRAAVHRLHRGDRITARVSLSVLPHDLPP